MGVSSLSWASTMEENVLCALDSLQPIQTNVGTYKVESVTINKETKEVVVKGNDMVGYHSIDSISLAEMKTSVLTALNGDYNDYKTNIRCISNGFINKKDINTVLNFRPSKGCHPNCMKNYMIWLKTEITLL